MPNGWHKVADKKLTSSVAEKSGLSIEDASRAIDALVSSVAEALSHGEATKIKGFGTFTVKERAARMGRNPRTGETIHVPSKNVAVFKPGPRLKEYLE